MGEPSHTVRAVCAHALWMLPSEAADRVAGTTAAKRLKRKDWDLWANLVLPLLGGGSKAEKKREEDEAKSSS